MRQRAIFFAWYESDSERRVFIARPNSTPKIAYTRRKAPKTIQVMRAGRLHNRRIEAISETFEQAEARVNAAINLANEQIETSRRAALRQKTIPLRPKPQGRGGLAVALTGAALAGTTYIITTRNQKR